MKITEADLLDILDESSGSQHEKTVKLNSFGDTEIEITIGNWTIDDWRPRDEWFLIRYLLVGKVDKLKLVFTPSQQLNGNISEIIDDLKTNEGAAIRVQGVSEGGGHAMSSMFSVNITNLSYT